MTILAAETTTMSTMVESNGELAAPTPEEVLSIYEIFSQGSGLSSNPTLPAADLQSLVCEFRIELKKRYKVEIFHPWFVQWIQLFASNYRDHDDIVWAVDCFHKHFYTKRADGIQYILATIKNNAIDKLKDV